MNTYKLVVSYNGTRYSGWQIQPKPEKTVQGEINQALEILSKSKDIKTMGSGRTDTGVHAWGQMVKVTLPIFIPADSLMKGLNTMLPADIRVVRSETCHESFHPTKDAKSKEYRYIMFEGDNLPPFWEGRATLVKPGVDWKLVRETLNYFVGEKDFVNFSTKGTPVHSTVRTISRALLIEKTVSDFGSFQIDHESLREISLEGSGFLKQMVRLIVGAALSVGRGKRELDQLNDFFNCEVDHKFAAVAPADGLYLNKVFY